MLDESANFHSTNAGAEGIEPPSQLLESWVLPLNDAPFVSSARLERATFRSAI